MARPKEEVRQNKAMRSILRGETPEKRVMVGYEGKSEEGGDKISHLSEVMKEARMPWFCPNCKKYPAVHYNRCLDPACENSKINS